MTGLTVEIKMRSSFSGVETILYVKGLSEKSVTRVKNKNLPLTTSDQTSRAEIVESVSQAQPTGSHSQKTKVSASSVLEQGSDRGNIFRILL